MTFYDTDGNVLNKTEMLALTTEETQETIHVFTEDVHQTFTQNEGNATYEGADRLLFHAGQRVAESVINGLFETATATAIEPATGPAAGGTVVVITGTNLAGVEGVTFDAVAGTELVRLSDTRIQVKTPAGSAGTADVVVQDDAGNVSKPAFFTYT
jgi:hypothetical protein